MYNGKSEKEVKNANTMSNNMPNTGYQTTVGRVRWTHCGYMRRARDLAEIQVEPYALD
jgi:hypothetical protein